MKNIFKAVLITTILGVLTKILSFLLKIYISRKIGAEAVGFYQISLSAFFLLCSLVTSGLPLIISRRVAKDNSAEAKTVGAGLIIALAITAFVITLVLCFPNLFSAIWGQHQSLNCLYILLPAVLFTAIYVPLRGSLWGKKQFFELGMVELIEQIAKFIFCVILFNVLLTLNGETVTALIYTLACFVSTIVAIIFYIKKGGKLKPNTTLIKPLLKESIPIATVRIGTSVVAMLISVIMPAMLTHFGSTLNEAVADFGVAVGMTFPLLSVPGIIIGSIAVALLPEISSGNADEIKKQINSSLSYSIMISLILFPIFFILGDKIGIWLYGNALSGELLKAGSFLLLPLGVSQITSSILNALGKEKRGLIIQAISAVSLIVSILILPKFCGIYSLLWGFGAMNVLASILNLFAIKEFLTREPLTILIKNMIMCIPACLFALFVNGICTSVTMSNVLSIIASSSVSVGSLVIMLIAFNMVDIKQFFHKKPRKQPATIKN